MKATFLRFLSGVSTVVESVAASIASLIVAFFGGITIVIAAITAALCTGKDAHEDPSKRYVAGISNGVFYLIGGFCGATIVSLYMQNRYGVRAGKVQLAIDCVVLGSVAYFVLHRVKAAAK